MLKSNHIKFPLMLSTLLNIIILLYRWRKNYPMLIINSKFALFIFSKREEIIQIYTLLLLHLIAFGIRVGLRTWSTIGTVLQSKANGSFGGTWPSFQQLILQSCSNRQKQSPRLVFINKKDENAYVACQFKVQMKNTTFFWKNMSKVASFPSSRSLCARLNVCHAYFCLHFYPINQHPLQS